MTEKTDRKISVLHISKTFSTGGAGFFAKDLSGELQNHGVDSLMAAAKTSKESDIITLRNRTAWIFEEILDRFTRFFGYQYPYFPFSKASIESCVKKLSPDIVHLHNIHSGFFPFSLLEKLAEKALIVWTIHDMWPFTGHCAVPGQCSEWEKFCKKCPDLKKYPSTGINRAKKHINRKAQLYEKISDRITFIFPSEDVHMKYQSKDKIFSNLKTTVIFNGIKNSVFQAVSQKEARKKLSLPRNRFLFLFTAEHLSLKTKGGHDLEKIIKYITQKTHIKTAVLTAGKQSVKYSGMETFHMGYMPRKLMKYVYSAADIMITPSYGECFGLTILEAVFCGLPVTGYSTGILPELLGPENQAPVGEVRELAEKTFSIIKQKDYQYKLRPLIKKFSLEKCAENYKNLYEKILY
ncbi:MAG: glycosyltransferase [bacterium]